MSFYALLFQQEGPSIGRRLIRNALLLTLVLLAACAYSPNSPGPSEQALQEQVARVKRLEEEQQRLLTEWREKTQRYEERCQHADLDANWQLACKQIAEQTARINKSIEDYNERPRKGVYGINTKSRSTPLYVGAWQKKIEEIGNQNYPEEAQGKYYGQLVMTVYLKVDGSVADIILDKSSGNDILDRAAIQIVRMGEPYARFTDEMRAEMDVLVLTRTWIFTNDSLLTK